MSRSILAGLLLAAILPLGCGNSGDTVTPGQPTAEQQAAEAEYTRQTEEAMKQEALREQRGN
jgi:hypothetical protein